MRVGFCHVSLWSSLTSGSYNLPAFSSEMVPEPLGKGCVTGLLWHPNIQLSLILYTLECFLLSVESRTPAQGLVPPSVGTSSHLREAKQDSSSQPHPGAPGDLRMNRGRGRAHDWCSLELLFPCPMWLFQSDHREAGGMGFGISCHGCDELGISMTPLIN